MILRFRMILACFAALGATGCTAHQPQIVLVKNRFESHEAMVVEADRQCQNRYKLRAIESRSDSLDTIKFTCN